MEFLIVLGAGAILFGLACVVSIIRLKHNGQGMANWPRVGGTITESFVYTHARQTLEQAAVTYTPVVAYTYVVDGKTYRANKRDGAPYYGNSTPRRAEADARIAALPAGKAVRVRYNPHVPEQSVLHVSRPIAHNAVLLFGIMDMLIGVGCVVLGVVYL